jgi:hypothetical protein
VTSDCQPEAEGAILVHGALGLACLRWKPLKDRHLLGWWHVALAAMWALLLIVFLLFV